MRRALLAGLATGAMVTTTAVGASAGTSPRIYHTIGSSLGSAVVTQVVDCEQTEVFVSSSVAMYAAQPGPVTKQGLTGVLVRVTDVCGGQPGLAKAPAAGGGVVVFEAEGQNGAGLVVDPRLTRGSVSTTMSGEDAAGHPVTIELDASWTGTGPLEHSTAHTHVLFPGAGVVSSTANDRRREASAEVTVRVAGRTVSAGTTDAVLEQDRSRCIEVPRPGVEEFYPCFGFPG